jgi:D-alanyl-lipoteichoic acid acyltransferase DltB (MBOAT superfamily)
MLFSSSHYAALLLFAFAGFWALAAFLPGRRTLRSGFLLAVSYFFYGTWNPRYLALILFTSTHDYCVGRLLGAARRPAHRRLLLAASVGADLAVLGAFKYFDFFADSVAALLAAFGVEAVPPHLGLLLPVGISFYTFQSLSYTIEVYRGRLAPTRNCVDYLAYVAFFPQLLAGPIARAAAFLPQLLRAPALTSERASRAIFWIGLGLVKKIAIADVLGSQLVNPVFSNPVMYSATEALAAVYGYSFQIYMDFSAYSDIAIGSAALLGFELPRNFDAPYAAASLREFWQRWHISLSTWLRDFLYIPLGGSRRGAFRTYLALIATMFLGGLWHGPAARFVVWGLVHGAALVVTRIVQRSGLPDRIPEGVRRGIGIFVTFHVVSAAWVFFGAPSFEGALAVFRALGSLELGAVNVGWSAIAALAVAAATHGLRDGWLDRVVAGFHRIPAPVQAALLVAAVLVARELAATEVAPFIYFQF